MARRAAGGWGGRAAGRTMHVRGQVSGQGFWWFPTGWRARGQGVRLGGGGLGCWCSGEDNARTWAGKCPAGQGWLPLARAWSGADGGGRGRQGRRAGKAGESCGGPRGLFSGLVPAVGETGRRCQGRARSEGADFRCHDSGRGAAGAQAGRQGGRPLPPGWRGATGQGSKSCSIHLEGSARDLLTDSLWV